MNPHLLLLLLLTLLLAQTHQKSPQPFTINLDLPPRHRYQAVSKTKQKNINSFLTFLHSDPKYKVAFKTARALAPFLRYFVGREFYEECLGIAEVVGRHVSQLVVFNYMYELGAYSDFCTSVAVQGTGGGYFLGRNLDYGFQQYLADNSVQLSYIRNGNLIFQTIGHAGMIGAHTGLRIDGYSVTLNERIDGGLHRTLEQIFLHRAYNVPYLVQQTLRHAGTVEEAYGKLLGTRVCAAVYFILNADGRNILIEKQRKGAKGVFQNNHFIVQTNTDTDQPDPDTRRDIAYQKMTTLHQANQTTPENVWKILTSPPNKNKLTLITVMLDTKNNKINATVWEKFQ